MSVRRGGGLGDALILPFREFRNEPSSSIYPVIVLSSSHLSGWRNRVFLLRCGLPHLL